MNGVGLLVTLAAVVLVLAFGWYRRAVDGRVAAADGSRPPLLPDQLKAQLGERVTFLQFSSPACAPCHQTARLLGEVAADNDGYAHLEVPAEQHLDLVQQLGISRTPTVLLLDGDGQVRHRIVGAPRRNDLLLALDQLQAASEAA